MVLPHNSDWQIREATEDDLMDIRSLYKSVWGHLRPESYDRWRYYSSPLGSCPISVAVSKNRLVGAFMVGPLLMRIGNDVVKGGHAMDVMSHPDYVGQPVFLEVGKHCIEQAITGGYQVFYGFPNSLSFPGFVRRLNWDHTGDITHWVRPICISGYKKKVPPMLGPLADFATHLLPKGSSRNFEIRIEKLSTTEIQPLIEVWQKGLKWCRVERDQSWFRWRYSKETLSDYEWICAYEEGQLKALAIWGIRNRQWGEIYDGRAHLTEMLGSSPLALQAVLRTVIDRARQRKAILLETVTNIPKLEKIIRQAGFFANKKIPLIIKSLGDNDLSANIHHHPNWQIFGGDVDTF